MLNEIESTIETCKVFSDNEDFIRRLNTVRSQMHYIKKRDDLVCFLENILRRDMKEYDVAIGDMREIYLETRKEKALELLVSICEAVKANVLIETLLSNLVNEMEQ